MEPRWRRLTVDALELSPGERVLDVAAGTAVSTDALRPEGATAVWVTRGLPVLGRLMSSDSPAYAYLAESTLARAGRARPDHWEAGWSEVAWRPLSLGRSACTAR